MAETISRLQSKLKWKTEPEKASEIERFVATLDSREKEFYNGIYGEVDRALNEKRHVTQAQHLTTVRGVFMPNMHNFGLYYQIGRVINGKDPITPAEAVRLMNKNNPKPRKSKTRKGPPILGRYQFLERGTSQRSPREDEMKD